MKDLVPIAEKIAAVLIARKQTIAIAESSTAGLISAALLAVPGASAYFLGGAVVYTRQSRRLLLDIPDAALDGLRPSTEPYALMMARHTRQRFATTFALAETGATGPTGNRYGDAAGHSCIAVAGPSDGAKEGAKEGAMTLETGQSDRLGNMNAFTAAALNFLLEKVSG
jgi:PncC family amidohydrolase